MIFYLPEMQALEEIQASRERRYYRLPSGGTLAAELYNNDQVRVVEIISTDLNDYMNDRIQPGSILHLEPNVNSSSKQGLSS